MTSASIVVRSNEADDCTIMQIDSEENDRERLIKPRNNFISYSNEDVDVRFRVSRISDKGIYFPFVKPS
jgi:hypothetical protein